jgi:hypothetical protein
MEAKESSWLTNIPQSWKYRLGAIPGGRDPRHTMVAVSTLTMFAIKRGEKPKFLSHLIADPTTHTGAAGRPTSMHLVAAEMEKRAAEGTLLPKISKEASQLSEWVKSQYPTLPAPKPKTISNSLREKYWSLRPSMQSPKL